VREARDGAKKEIEAYRAEKEAEFKKFESEVWRYISSALARLVPPCITDWGCC